MRRASDRGRRDVPGSGLRTIDSIPTTAEVDRIATLSDPVVRNLQITQCYHELAMVLAARVGGANWCTFATWASRQAGQTIRKEDFARLLENAMGAAPVRAQAAPDVAASAQALGSRRNTNEVQETVWEVINPPFTAEQVAIVKAGRVPDGQL